MDIRPKIAGQYHIIIVNNITFFLLRLQHFVQIINILPSFVLVAESLENAENLKIT